MNKRYIVALAFAVSSVVFPVRGIAAIEQSPKSWQLQSLKGITSIEYCVMYDPGNKIAKTVVSELSGTKVPMKSVNSKEDFTPLSPTEARLKVVVDDREKNQSWVGLYVEQKSKLDRNPSITFDGETYKIGTLCAKSDADSKVKELCAQFAHDFNLENQKHK